MAREALLVPTISSLYKMMRSEDQTSRFFNELCSLLLAVIRSPHVAFPSSSAQAAAGHGSRRPQLSAAGMTALLLGASMTMMLCGSLTFMIGFVLMPWVVGLGMLFSFFGIVSNLSGIGRAMLCPAAPSPSTKEIPACLFSKCPID